MDYNNQLSELEVNRQNDLTQLNQQYQNAITETEQAYKQAADQYTIDANDGRTTAVEQLMETQTALTEQAVKEIEQQREQSEKDYIKEQAGAYADWQKQSDAYGVNAEKMASNGLTRSGYSESSQVQMYSDYQSRVSTARDVFKRAELNFTNAIANARLQNNAALAQIALDAFQRQSEIALAGLTAKNGLLSEWTSQKLAVNTRYDNKYQTILDQIYREEQMQLERDKMQLDADLAYARMAQDAAQHSASLAQSQAQFEAGLAADKEKLKWQETQAQLEREWEAEQDQLGRDWQAQQDQIDRDWRAQQSALDRAAKDKITGATTTNKDDLGNGGSGLLFSDGGSDNGGNTVYDGVTIAGLGAPTETGALANPLPQLGNLTPKWTAVYGNSGKTGSSVGYSAYIPGGAPKTRMSAIHEMQSAGVPPFDASTIMTANEWARHKNSSQPPKDVQNTATYQDYLAAQVIYKTNLWKALKQDSKGGK
jgi:hypothetical protein